MKTRAYNFGAGPSMLPSSILEEAKRELLDWQGLQMSVMEIGHRSLPFQALMEELESKFRDLCGIPDDYDVLFLGGAARTQFAMIPMNLLADGEQAGYLISGTWSLLAYQEACKLKKAYCIASSESDGFLRVPTSFDNDFPKNTTYVYYTPNETINGVRFNQAPDVGSTPLVADMTSCLLCEPFKVKDYALIFAGAQKNISIAGLTIVIVRKSMVESKKGLVIPTMMDYKTHAEHRSLYATPPTFNCYLALKMMDWVKAHGGVEELFKINQLKAKILYDYIDASSFYQSRVEKSSRSIENVCFSIIREELEPAFIEQAAQEGLLALKGHKAVGGLRASLYNAMPLEGVESLIAFMQSFLEDNN